MYNEEKFKELVHYVCWKSEDPAKLGATKLNKVLWFSELNTFLRTGSSISGSKFVKRQFGPVPKAILQILDRLQDEQKIVIRDSDYYGRSKRDFISIKRPNLNVFSSEEISLVDKMINVVCEKHTAASISSISHDSVWEMAEIGEEMPLYTVFAKRGEVTEDDISWARSVAA